MAALDSEQDETIVGQNVDLPVVESMTSTDTVDRVAVVV